MMEISCVKHLTIYKKSLGK